MNNRQQISKLINKVEAAAKQCRKDGDIELARKYEADLIKLLKELVEINNARVQELLSK